MALVPFNRYLGITVKEVRRGFAELLVPYREELVGDPMRPALHGGVLSALIDTAGGAAVWTGIESGDRIATVDLRVDYLRPAPLEDLICQATVVRLGNRVGVADMKIVTVADPVTVLATGKGVYNVRRRRRSASEAEP
ncbi:MAG: hotdog fold thioesterase [Deltaproteobacteria bacterium]|nr:hotdog fold thioesterase [Deltaproteobacteria bacterium]